MSTPNSRRRASGHVYTEPRKKGRVWYAKYRHPDPTAPGGVRQVKTSLGLDWPKPGRPPSGYLTKKMAEDALRALLVDAERGTLAGMNRAGATFADAAAEYLRYVEQVRQRDATTVKDYRGVITGYLVPEFGERDLAAITADDVDAYKERLMAEGRLSNRTIVRHLTVLHGVFKRAKRVYGLADNPASAELVDRPTVTYTGEFETFTRDEVELLAAHAANAQDAALFRTAAYTGLRQGELLALRWRDVDLVGGLLHVRRNYTDRTEKVPKGKRVRSVPMTPAVVDALATLKDREHFTADEDLVFCDDVGGFLNGWSMRRRYYAALERAGLRRLRFHDLRHCFGSAAITRLDAYAVQSYMGHQHYSTTQRYLHHKPRAADAAALHDAFAGTSPAGSHGSPDRSPTVPIEAN